MTLFLHIGPTKTASTLGQILFASAPDSGACRYLAAGRARRGGVGRVHHPVAIALQTPETPQAQTLMTAIEACLAQAQAASHSVLISSEMLPPDPQACRPLLEMAARTGHAVRVVFVCRDPVARINSMYTQDIKTGALGPSQGDTSIAAYVETTLASPLALATLQPCTVLRPGFAALGAGFDLLPYHATGMDQIYRQFCAQLGLAVTQTAPAESRVNAGPSAAAIRLLREGAVAPDAPNLYSVLQTADRRLAQPAYFGMTPALAARIRAALADELTDLRAAPMRLGAWQDEVFPALHDEAAVQEYEGYKSFVLDLARTEAERAAAWTRRTQPSAKPAGTGG
jgi:hypothetical protein